MGIWVTDREEYRFKCDLCGKFQPNHGSITFCDRCIEERPEDCELWIGNFHRDCRHVNQEPLEEWIEEWREWRENRLRGDN